MERICGDWVETYLSYTRGHEAPREFHLWTALSILSAAVRRNVWLDRGFYTIYPNLYVVFVAESARLRKSVAQTIGIDLLRCVEDVHVVHERVTPEALIEKLSVIPQVLVWAPELTVFLGGDDQMSRRLIALLVSLFDGKEEWEYLTKGAGKFKLRQPLITFLGATTPALLQQIPQDAIGGGFAGRTFFISASERQNVVAWGRITERERVLAEGLRRDLKFIAGIRGPFEVSKEAHDAYETWYKGLGESDDPRMSGFMERIHDHALRVAMILVLARKNDTLMEVADVRKGIAIVEGVHKYMSKALEFIGSTEHSRDAKRLLTSILRHGGEISHSRLLQINSWKLSAVQMKEVVQTLVERGELDVIRHGRQMYYRVVGQQKLSDKDSQRQG